jgi:hypothetical protein
MNQTFIDRSTTTAFVLFVLCSVCAAEYLGIPVSPVSPFFADSCTTPVQKDVVYVMDFSASMRTRYAGNPGVTNTPPSDQHLFWGPLFSSMVFRIAGWQTSSSDDNGSQQVPLEIVTDLILATADGDLAAAGLTYSEIQTLHANGMVNPTGDANMFFTGAWVGARSWATPLHKPAPSWPGPVGDTYHTRDCWQPTGCRLRYMVDNPDADLDGGDRKGTTFKTKGTAIVIPAPAKDVVAKWMVKNAMRSNPQITQSLIAIPKNCLSQTQCEGGVVFSGTEPEADRLKKLQGLWGAGSTPTADAVAEMKRFLGCDRSYNNSWSYCQGGHLRSPLQTPGDPNSQFRAIFLWDAGPHRDCRIPGAKLVTTNPNKYTIPDLDGDGNHDPAFPDENGSDQCNEGLANNWLVDDVVYDLKQDYPQADLDLIYFGPAGIYGDDQATCISGDNYCQYNVRVAERLPAGSRPNNTHVTNRWNGVESILNNILSDMGAKQPSLPSFSGSPSTYVSAQSNWLIPTSYLESYTGDFTRVNTNGGDLSIPPPEDSVVWSYGSLFRNADKTALRIYTTIDGKNAQEFKATNSTLVTELLSDNPSDPDDPDWHTNWNSTNIVNAINYIRGVTVAGLRERSYPGQTGDWPLAEIFNNPIYIGPPRSGYSECLGPDDQDKGCYRDFADSNRSRTPMVAFATGDGQLRVVNYNTGALLYSFIPRASLQSLQDYPKTSYTRKTYIGGTIQAFDVYDGSQWRTYLLAGLAQGGKTYVALDVTDPDDIQFKFEIRDAAFGLTFSPVTMQKFKSVTQKEVFYFVTGSGYNNSIEQAGSTAYLVAFDLNGNIVKRMTVSDKIPNGVTSVFGQDANDDGLTDGFVIGTFAGELVKIRSKSADAGWTVAKTLADFGKPITARIHTSRINGYTYIYGGTGKLLSDADLTETPPPQEYFFAFRDNPNSDVPVTLDTLSTYTPAWRDYDDDHDPDTPPKRYITLGASDDTDGLIGYKIQLPQGHRVLTPPVTLADGVLFSSMDPDKTDCTVGGRSLTWYVSQQTNPNFVNRQGEIEPNFEVNGDGKVDSNDSFEKNYPVAAETTSLTFAVNAQIDFRKQLIDTVTIETYNQTGNEGVYYGRAGHVKIRNRLVGFDVNWKESTEIK